MKVELLIAKDGVTICSGTYQITGAKSFGEALADLWSKIRQKQFNQETSIGALMDHLDSDVLDQLDGANITMKKI